MSELNTAKLQPTTLTPTQLFNTHFQQLRLIDKVVRFTSQNETNQYHTHLCVEKRKKCK